MQVVLQSGGLGTRLYPLTKNKPKCFLDINGKSIFSFQYDNLKKYNLHKNLLIISNDKHVAYFEKFFENKKFKPKIISEKYGLGSGGSLKKNFGNLEKKFILIYLDIFFSQINFKKFLNTNKNQNKIFSHISTHRVDSDLIDVNKDNQIIKIYNKNKNKNSLSRISISGIFLLNKSLFHKIKIKKFDLTKLIIKKIRKTIFYSYFTNENFNDFGTKERYKKLIKNFNKNLKNFSIILDRDGTILSENKFLNSEKKIRFYSQFIDFLRVLKNKKIILVCITNQPGIAKGFIKDQKVKKIHDSLNRKLFKKLGLAFDRFYYCPHHPDQGFKGEIKKLKIKCQCRKPNSELFLKAINDFDLDKNFIINIGNSFSDIQAGMRSGIKNNFLINHKIKRKDKKKNYTVLNFKDLIREIRKFKI